MTLSINEVSIMTLSKTGIQYNDIQHNKNKNVALTKMILSMTVRKVALIYVLIVTSYTLY